MAEKTDCKATVWGERGHSWGCSNKAGYGPNKAYCKIHAREMGEKCGYCVEFIKHMQIIGGNHYAIADTPSAAIVLAAIEVLKAEKTDEK